MSKQQSKITALLEDLVKRSKTDRKLLVALKQLAVRSQSYELAADLRELEHIEFPDTEEIKKLREKADLIRRVFQMADMNVDERTCMKIELLMNIVNDLKDGTSLEDIVKVNFLINNVYPQYPNNEQR
jgi:hypothetical protein